MMHCLLLILGIAFSHLVPVETANSQKVLTYNVWLHESLPDTYATKESRKQRIIKALKKSDADLVCLQEVFMGQDVEDLVRGLADEFPYTFSGIHTAVNEFPPQASGTRQPPCDFTRYSNLFYCLTENNCTKTTSASEIGLCLFTKCKQFYDDMLNNEPQECLTCFYTSLLNPLSCSAPVPVVGGKQINNGGLLALSKRALSDASFTSYFPGKTTTLGRGYIHAKVGGNIDMFCTHLEVTDEKIPFYGPALAPLGITTFAEKNRYEIKSLIRALRGISHVIVLGDFNTGLAFKQSTNPETPENYLLLLNRLATRPALKCTYCDPEDPAVIDHVFAKNMIIRKTRRMFVSKRWSNKMSDHVGVQSVVVLPPRK